MQRIDINGNAASLGAATGTVRIFHRPPIEGEEFNEGDILVTTMTDPRFVPWMKIAGAIVTDEGGRTCHAAIVAREFMVPCIVGARTATTTLRNGQRVRVVISVNETSIYDMEGE